MVRFRVRVGDRVRDTVWVRVRVRRRERVGVGIGIGWCKKLGQK